MKIAPVFIVVMAAMAVPIAPAQSRQFEVASV